MSKEDELFRIRYEIDDNVKMDLSVFSRSLSAFADSYSDFANSRRDICPVLSTLKISDVRRKCIEIELFPQLAATAIACIEAINNTSDFIEYLKNLWAFFSGRQNATTPTLRQSQNFKDIIGPVAQGQSSQFNGCTFNGTVVFNVTPQTASVMSARADDYIAQLNQSTSVLRERVLLNIFQARDSTSNKGDRAIVNEISPKPIKTTFDTPFIKNQILHPVDGNIFDKKYLVDVSVTHKNNKPREYRVLRIHEAIATARSTFSTEQEFDFE